MNYQNNHGNETLPWPYPLLYGKINHVAVDVLVVGGGLAGGMAGIAAARKGASVAVADKAPIRRSGNGGAGMDHWNNVLAYDGSPMSPEENLERGNTLFRQGHRDYIALKGAWEALLELEKLGLPIRDENGDFLGCPTRDEKTNLLKAYDYRKLVAVKLRGGYFIKPVIYDGLKKEKNVTLYERVMITSLLTEGGKQGAPLTGAAGFSMETGEFYVFHTKALILSTGYVCSLWTFSTELTGNSYRWDPNEIGEGFAMVLNAGGKVLNLHKNGHTRAAHPFAWPRFGVGNPSNTWFPCTVVDDNGKEIPWEDKNGKLLSSVEARNLPTADQVYCGSPISDDYKGILMPNLIHDLPERIRSGEFVLPLWADLPSMPERERRSIWGMMIGNEGKTRYTLYDYYTRLGFDPDKDMLMAPIMGPEGYKSGGWFQGEPQAVKPWRSESFGCQGEPAVDWKLMTSVPGVFCAGAASGLEGCSYACSSGFYAGEQAASFAEGKEALPVDREQLMGEIERVYAPVKRLDKGGDISFKELWAGSARAMQQCCGDNITVPILKQGLLWIESIKKNEMLSTFARNPHELARVMECETRIACSEAFLRGGIARLEADKAGLLDKDTLLFNHWENGVFCSEYDKDKYWLRGDNAPDYLTNYRRAREGR